MTKAEIVRAWKDPKFRASLSEDQLAALPASPVGGSVTELTEDQLQNVGGGETGTGLIPTVSGDCNGGLSCWTILKIAVTVAIAAV